MMPRRKNTKKITRIRNVVAFGLFASVIIYFNLWKPVQILAIDGCLGQFNMVSRGDYVYNVCGERMDIITFAESKKNTPIIVGEYLGDVNLYEVGLYKEYALITSTYNGINVIDISNPNSPILVANFPKDKNVRYSDLLIHEDLAFIYNTWDMDMVGFELGNSIDILDISDPRGIRRVSRIFDVGEPLTIVGSYLYTNRGLDENGIHNYLMSIVDISDVENPIVVDILDEFGSVNDAVVREELLYLGTNGKLIVTDISDPLAPVEIGSADQSMEEILLAGDALYYWTYPQVGVYYFIFPQVGVYNISDPTHPFKLASYRSINASALAISNNYVFYGGHYARWIHIFPALGD